MKYWIGAILGACGAYLFLAAQAHRARIRAARADAVRLGRTAERPIAADSVAALGEMVTPIVLIALGWFTLKLCFAYYILSPVNYFTLFDLIGTLVLVAGYASWLVAKTHYRMPDLSVPALVADETPASVPIRVRQRTPARQDDLVLQPMPYAPAADAKSAQSGYSME
ncbi:MAG: hypothetical protein ACKVP4_07885 [Hyphomicrobium sp.]